jgi:hypothetical protein
VAPFFPHAARLMPASHWPVDVEQQPWQVPGPHAGLVGPHETARTTPVASENRKASGESERMPASLDDDDAGVTSNGGGAR